VLFLGECWAAADKYKRGSSLHPALRGTLRGKSAGEQQSLAPDIFEHSPCGGPGLLHPREQGEVICECASGTKNCPPSAPCKVLSNATRRSRIRMEPSYHVLAGVTSNGRQARFASSTNAPGAATFSGLLVEAPNRGSARPGSTVCDHQNLDHRIFESKSIERNETRAPFISSYRARPEAEGRRRKRPETLGMLVWFYQLFF